MSGIVIGVVIGIESIIEGLRQIVTKLAFDIGFTNCVTYQKVVSSNLSHLVAHAGFFSSAIGSESISHIFEHEFLFWGRIISYG